MASNMLKYNKNDIGEGGKTHQCARCQFTPIRASIMQRIFVVLGVILLGAGLAWAAETLNWTFSIDNPIQFDSSEIALSNDMVVLKAQNQTANNKNTFDSGKFINSLWDDVNQYLVVQSVITLPNNGGSTDWANMAQNQVLIHADASPVFDGFNEAFPNSSGQEIQATCTMPSCPQVDATGKIATSLFFDGVNDYLALSGTWGGADWNEATIEAWVRVDAVTSDMQAIVSTTAADMFVHFQMLKTGDKFNVAVYADNGSKVIDFDPSASTLTVGEWHHVAASVKSGDIALYADGIKVGGSNFTFGSLKPIINGNEFRVGSGYGKARFFRGKMDEVAVYKRALTSDEIKSHFDKQSAGLASSYESRLFVAGSPVVWNELSWMPAGPNGVQLPDDAQKESSYYAGNADMTGNVMLLHFNDEEGTSMVDSSGLKNNAVCSGAACPTFGQSGIFDKSIRLYDDNVVSDVTVPNSASLQLTKAVTMEAWVNPSQMPTAQGYGLISKGSYDGTPYYAADYELNLSGSYGLYPNALVVTFQMVNHNFKNATGGTSTAIAGGNVPLNQWSHVVGTYDAASSTVNIYLNGVKVASQVMALGGDITASAKPLMVGVRHVHLGTNYKSPNESHFRGRLDDVAVYNRVLSPDEIQSHYLRGALQPKFQVRTCDEAACAGSKYFGPGNSSSTYYVASALSQVPKQKAILSNLPLSKYFQYKVILDSKSANLFPALKSISVGPEHYSSTNPTVTVPTGVSYASLDSFSAELGPDNKGEVRYQLSPDGETWYFCYGTKWQKTTDPLVMDIPELGELQKTNSAAKVSQCASSFGSVAGAGKIFLKAFLHSPTSTELVELKSFQVGYSQTPAVKEEPTPSSVTLTDIPTITIGEGSKLSLTLDASKSGLTGPFQYICQANCPEGMSIDSTSGEITWTPNYTQAGKYADIQFKVTDAANKDATQGLSVAVNDVNMPPKITNPGDKVVTAGQNVSFTIDAKDEDGGVPVYSIVSGKQTGMELNTSTGYFSWTPSPEQTGAYTVMVRAVDNNDPKSFSDQAVIIVVNKSETSSIIGNSPIQVSTPEVPQAPTAQTPEGSTQTAGGSGAQPSGSSGTAGCTLIR